MSTFYKTNHDDDEGIYIPPNNCINYIEVFRPLNTDFNFQREHERRGKGFYRYVDENKTITLMTLDLMFDLAKQQHNRNTLKEIKILSTSFEVKYNRNENVLNDYLVGYEEIGNGTKSYFVTKFSELPGGVLFCPRNVRT